MTGQEARDDEREALIAELKAAAESLRYDEEEWGGSEVAEAWDESRSLLTRAARALARKHPEPEWEYGIRPADDDVPLGIEPMPTLEVARARANNIRGGWAIIRRRPAGPWVPVGEGDRG